MVITIAVLVLATAYFRDKQTNSDRDVFKFEVGANVVATEPTREVVREPATTKPSPNVKSQNLTTPEPNLGALQAWMTKYGCIEADLAGEYIHQAQIYGIDWRLLPAISRLESQCGRHYINNNLWGWASGKKKFENFSQGIAFVSEQLANASYYKGKGTREKLQTYNRNPGYPERVIQFMESISK